MKAFYPLLLSIPLFQGISDTELPELLICLNAQQRQYLKGQNVFSAGECVSSIGIVLSGCVQVVSYDILGNKTIIGGMQDGELFAEAFTCSHTKKLPVSVEAQTDSYILLIDYSKIITVCSSACIFHHRLIENMLNTLARKNVMLTQKIGHISKRSTREKLLSYLSDQAQKSESKTFTIPFNRQELADYLCVERSAMSAELSRMRQDGLVDFSKNSFELYPA